MRLIPMIFRIKNFVYLAILLLGSWLGWSSYTYFFDYTKPCIQIAGIEDGHFYAGEIQCMMTSDKKGEVVIWLDDQEVLPRQKLHKKSPDGEPFQIPTRTIANGKHMLKAEFVDTTYHKNTARIEREFYIDNAPLQAAFVQNDADLKVLQGRTLHLQFQANKPIDGAQVHALANSYECFPESKNSLLYECFIPIACEEKPSEYLLSIDVTDRVGNALHVDKKFQVVMYPFKKTTLQVNADKIKEEEEMGIAMKELEQQLELLTKTSPTEKLWRGSFCTPIDIQRVTCEFGTIRTTQHKGRYAHKALDVINTPKSVVWAPQDGIVVLKERYDASGNTVVIDHGCGVLSLFFHLDDFAKVNVGDKVAKGNPIGTLGKTGYATGYHLHWEMRVQNVAIDPMQWTKNIF